MLTSTELKIVTLVKQAKTNRQIATELHIAEGTVKTHIRHILIKTGAKSKAELIIKEVLINMVNIDNPFGFGHYEIVGDKAVEAAKEYAECLEQINRLPYNPGDNVEQIGNRRKEIEQKYNVKIKLEL